MKKLLGIVICSLLVLGLAVGMAMKFQAMNECEANHNIIYCLIVTGG